MKRAFKIKKEAFFITFDGLSLKQIKKKKIWKVRVQLYFLL